MFFSLYSKSFLNLTILFIFFFIFRSKMSDDDDLDKFLKEIEEDECLNITVVAKQDASNTRNVGIHKWNKNQGMQSERIRKKS